jgi:DNA-binding transcriptional regulator GbsR (MarR family)
MAKRGQTIAKDQGKDDLEQTILFKAKGILPVISKAIDELEEKKSKDKVAKEEKAKLERFKRWQKVLEKWQEDEIPENTRVQRLEEIKELLIWDSENYE